MGIYLVTINNLKRCFHHKMLLGITLLLPVVICLIAGAIKPGSPSLRVGLLYQNGVQQKHIAQNITDILEKSKGIRYGRADINSFHTDMMMGRYQVILDLRHSSKASDYKLITYQSKEKRKLLEGIFHQSLLNNKPVILDRMKKEGLTKTERMLALFVTIFMIISSIQASKIILDRQNGTLMRYQFARRNHTAYLLGSMLYNFVITLIQLLICLLLILLLQRGLEIKPAVGILLCVLIAGIAVLFSTLICLGCKSEVQANITASSLAAILSLVGGTFITVGSMPGLLKILSYASPIRWILGLYHIM